MRGFLSYIRGVIEWINFPSYLSQLEERVYEMHMLEMADEKFPAVIYSAKDLHSKLETAQEDCLRSTALIKERVNAFRSRCLQAIDEAIPFLVHQPGWSQFLADIQGRLLSLKKANLPVHTQRLRLFEMPDRQLADATLNSVSGLSHLNN